MPGCSHHRSHQQWRCRRWPTPQCRSSWRPNHRQQSTGPPEVSPTPIALPALPPLFTSPRATAPPFALAVATPPLPALAMSVRSHPHRRNPESNPFEYPLRLPAESSPWQPRQSDASPHPHDSYARYHRSRVLSMLATYSIGPEHGTPSGIRTRDLHLERVTSWAARLWGQLREDVIA